jgi:hypothetical protein
MEWRIGRAKRSGQALSNLASRPVYRSHPVGPQWVHEIKHDGYRLIARKRDELGWRPADVEDGPGMASLLGRSVGHLRKSLQLPGRCRDKDRHALLAGDGYCRKY